ncbi:hypothetical protein COPCOM_00850 [Coprococcus comes ATCC 27758]|uniref:Uncharacterized protein n=1 Tax=Coprococcus comes ATCC 27758 TaxID=470146 RepID=C0B6S9_9FIRM|nr:hypothetical protein COPCOM_00850 [Coprococcus comes ATCC 27758]
MRKYITKASERIGVESTSRDGKRAQVVSYSTCENFIIRFCDGKEMKLKNWRYFIEGNFNYEKHFKAPRNREERIGEKKVMNNGLTAEVIEYRGVMIWIFCLKMEEKEREYPGGIFVSVILHILQFMEEMYRKMNWY